MQAALQLITKHGVQGLALSDAARLAGVSVAAPYRHFKDKEGLLAEIAEQGFAAFRDALAQAAQSHPKNKVERLVEMGIAYVAFARRHRSHFKVMWEGGISKAKYPAVGQTAHQAYELLQQAATALLPVAPPIQQQALVCAAWSVVHGYASLALEGELDVSPAHHDYAQAGEENLLRPTLHLLLDQFAGKESA